MTFFKAHSVMERGLLNEAGEFRSRPVGVADIEGNILHFGTLPQYVPKLIQELLEWTEKSEIHLLIKAVYFIMNLNLYIRLQTATVVWEDCGIRCCFQNGILYSHGCR